MQPSSGPPSIGSPLTAASPYTTILPTRRSNVKEHTREEWEAIRPRFAQLYISERRRLADVSRILREEHAFHATDKQYKDRVRKWGLKKNFKDKEKREALAANLSSPRKGHQSIPHHRLKRFARDAKLVYVQGAAGLPPEPRIEYGMVLELSRSLFDTCPNPNARTLYEAFAAVDRLSSARTPLLDFEVLGVSDTYVRYGLRRLERKAMPGVSFEMMPSGEDATGRKLGIGIRYCASVSTVLPNVQDGKKEHPTHQALFHLIGHSIYKACQYIYSPGSNPHNQHLYQARRTVYTPAKNPFNDVPIRPGDSPEVRCLHYKATAQAAQALYLRVVSQATLASGVLAVSDLADAEMFSVPHIGSGVRVAINHQQDAVFSMQPALNVAIHLIKRGNLFAAAIQFRPGYEAVPVFMEGRLEHEKERMSTLVDAASGGLSSDQILGLRPSSPSCPQSPPASGPTLTGCDAVEAEFRDVSRRAAMKLAFKPEPGRRMEFATGQITEFALVSRPMSAADAKSQIGRGITDLVREGSLLDRAEPWKRAKLLEYSQASSCRYVAT